MGSSLPVTPTHDVGSSMEVQRSSSFTARSLDSVAEEMYLSWFSIADSGECCCLFGKGGRYGLGL